MRARAAGTLNSGNPLAAPFVLSYNFVRPKAVLEGKTPAEKAGIEISCRSKWFGLVWKGYEEKQGGTNYIGIASGLKGASGMASLKAGSRW